MKSLSTCVILERKKKPSALLSRGRKEAIRESKSKPSTLKIAPIKHMFTNVSAPVLPIWVIFYTYQQGWRMDSRVERVLLLA